MTRISPHRRPHLGNRGSVSAMAASFALAFILAGTLAIDMSNLYVVKLQSQRVADLSALAAARTQGAIVATTTNGNTTYSLSPLADATALNLAAINGVTADESLNSVALDGNNNEAVLVTVSQPVPINFAAYWVGQSSVPVSANSFVEITTINATPCLYSTRFGIDIGLGGSVVGPKCVIQTASPAFGEFIDDLGGTFDVGAVNLGLTGLTAALEPLNILTFNNPTPPVRDFNYNVPADNYLATDSQILTAQAKVAALNNNAPAAPATPQTPAQPAAPFVFPTNIANNGTNTFGPDNGNLTLQTTPSNGANLYNANLVISDTTVTFAQPNGETAGCAQPMVVNGSLTMTNATLVFQPGCYVFVGTTTALAGANDMQIAPSGDPNATVTLEFQGAVLNQGNLNIGTDSAPPAATSQAPTVPVSYDFLVGVQNQNANGTLNIGIGPKTIGYLANPGGGTPDAGLTNSGLATTLGAGDLTMENATSVTNNGGKLTIGDATSAYDFFGGGIDTNAGTLTIGNGNYNLYPSPTGANGGNIQTNSGSTTLGYGAYTLIGGSINTLSGATSIAVGGAPPKTQSFSLYKGGNIQTTSGSTTIGYGPYMLAGGSILSLTGGTSLGAGGSAPTTQSFTLVGGSILSGVVGIPIASSITLGNGPKYLTSGNIQAYFGNITFGDGDVDTYGFPGGNIYTYTGSNLTIGQGNVNINGSGNIILDGNSATFGYGGSAVTGAGAINIADNLIGGSFVLLSGNFTAVGVSINDGSSGGLYLGGGGTISSGLVQLLQALNLPTDGLVGRIDLEAPTSSNPTYGEQDVAISMSYDPLGDFKGPDLTLLQDTTSNTIGGAIYDPAGAVSFLTAAIPGPSVSPPAGGCLEVYGASIVVGGGALNVSPCPGLKGSPADVTTTAVAIAQ